MTNRSQSVSAQLVVSLVAVVAVNSAVCWRWYKTHPKLENGDESEQKKQPTMRRKKRGLRSKNSKKVSTLRPSSTTTDKKIAPAASARRDGNGFRSPTLKMKERPLEDSSRLETTPAKKRKPRVRESLMPWKEPREASRLVLQQKQTAAGGKNVVHPKTPASLQKSATRVRRSLLPWNSEDEGPEVQIAKVKKTPRKLHVRDSLLPQNIRRNMNTESEIGGEDIMSICDTRSRDEGPKVQTVAVKKTPRKLHVRDSLLPQNIRPNMNTESEIVGEDTMSICDSRSRDEGPKVQIAKVKKTPRKLHVRDSLLPQNIRPNMNTESEIVGEDTMSICDTRSRDEGPKVQTVAVKKTPRKLHVRDSLLPQNIRPNMNTESEIVGEDTMSICDTSFQIQETEEKAKTSPKPSRDGLQSSRLHEVKGRQLFKTETSITKENSTSAQRPLLANIDLSNITTRSTASSFRSERKNFVETSISSKHIPLKNLSNAKIVSRKRGTINKRRTSTELKEQRWKKKLAVSKVTNQTTKSPTLTKLSRRYIDCDDVKSLCKVFEHRTSNG